MLLDMPFHTDLFIFKPNPSSAGLNYLWQKKKKQQHISQTPLEDLPRSRWAVCVAPTLINVLFISMWFYLILMVGILFPGQPEVGQGLSV